MVSISDNQSPVVTAVGFLVALVAVAGTQLLGWEWGSRQFIPAFIGVVVAGVAVVITARRILRE